MKELVSILMPFKNEEAYLEECLQSILNQSYSNWELIAIDDNSSDSSLEIIHRFQKQDSRIQVYQNKGQGIIPALRMAFEISSGSCITRMDADDWMPEQKLELLYKALMESGAGTVSTGYVKYFSEGELLDGYKNYEKWLNQLTDTNAHFNEIYKECTIASPCWMIRRGDLLKAGAFDSDIYPEDYDLCFRFYEAGLKSVGIPEVLHHWRDYPERSSRTLEHYSDPHFYHIKVQYFIKLEANESDQIVLWNAGKKAKQLAIILIENKVSFRWFCNNPKKIGQTIYDVLIEDYELLPKVLNPKILVPVAKKFVLQLIEDFLNEQGWEKNREYFIFG